MIIYRDLNSTIKMSSQECSSIGAGARWGLGNVLPARIQGWVNSAYYYVSPIGEPLCDGIEAVGIGIKNGAHYVWDGVTAIPSAFSQARTRLVAAFSGR